MKVTVKMNENNEKKYSFPLATVLTLIFLTLKLCKVITWSWWWVFSPLWISVIIWLIVFALVAIIGLISK